MSFAGQPVTKENILAYMADMGNPIEVDDVWRDFKTFPDAKKNVAVVHILHDMRRSDEILCKVSDGPNCYFSLKS